MFNLLTVLHNTPGTATRMSPAHGAKCAMSINSYLISISHRECRYVDLQLWKRSKPPFMIVSYVRRTIQKWWRRWTQINVKRTIRKWRMWTRLNVRPIQTINAYCIKIVANERFAATASTHSRYWVTPDMYHNIVSPLVGLCASFERKLEVPRGGGGTEKQQTGSVA